MQGYGLAAEDAGWATSDFEPIMPHTLVPSILHTQTLLDWHTPSVKLFAETIFAAWHLA